MHVTGLGLSLLKGSAQLHPRQLVTDTHGPVDDRRFCCVDPVAARVLRTVENPSLLRLRAGLDRSDGHEVLTLDVPGAGPVRAPVAAAGRLRADYWGRERDLQVLDGPWSRHLSTFLGRDVVLALAAPRDVVYGGGVTLVTTSSLREVAARAGTATGAGALVLDAERWRANVVVDTGDAPPFVEDDWLGRTLQLGEVRLRVGMAVPRCAVVRLRPGSGEREPWDPLALLAPDRLSDREIVFGVDAEVVTPGTVFCGEDLRLL